MLNRHCLRRSVTNKPITLWSCIRNCWAAEQTSQLGSFLEPIFAVINLKVSRGTFIIGFTAQRLDGAGVPATGHSVYDTMQCWLTLFTFKHIKNCTKVATMIKNILHKILCSFSKGNLLLLLWEQVRELFNNFFGVYIKNEFSVDVASYAEWPMVPQNC